MAAIKAALLVATSVYLPLPSGLSFFSGNSLEGARIRTRRIFFCTDLPDNFLFVF